MRVTSIHLKNFKRFTDLAIDGIPETAKLVVLVGANGCGKSSLFDALLTWYQSKVGFGVNNDPLYYQKSAAEQFNLDRSVTVTLAGSSVPARGCLYVRSAYRNDPDFSIGDIRRLTAPSESVRLRRIIDNDQVVSENYQRLVYETMAGVYNVDNDSKTIHDLREELIGGVRTSMKVVFGDLTLNNIRDPLGSGTFYFDKGSSRSYHYKNLSAGEKAAFDLLLDIHVKKNFFKNTIYCVDEMETHLHTGVQGALLKEMVHILPDACQLWVATHSLGVLRAAQDMIAETPGKVAVIDFDGIDPDTPAELMPSSLDRVTWEKLLSIALDDLSLRIAPKTVVICEGSHMGTRRKDFDAEIYNRILGSQCTGVLFVSGGSSNQIKQTGISVRDTLRSILPETKVMVLCDRDDMSTTEIADFEGSGGIVLGKRNLESYLLADDVIDALVQSTGKPELLDAAIRIKQDALAESVKSRHNPPDDLKSAAGETYIGLKQLLALQRCGNSTDTFLRDTLAPLIVPAMKTFLDLKKDVLNRVYNAVMK